MRQVLFFFFNKTTMNSYQIFLNKTNVIIQPEEKESPNGYEKIGEFVWASEEDAFKRARDALYHKGIFDIRTVKIITHWV